MFACQLYSGVNMKVLRHILLLTCLFLIVPQASAAQVPIIFFSDLISAPRQGWSAAEPDKGAAVTIWGKNLGSSRGSSYVTVGGVNLDANSDYPEPWGETGKPVRNLQRITFHLNNSVPLGMQEVTVTVGNVVSEALKINVTQEGIYFIDADISGVNEGTYEAPWTSPLSFVKVMAPGDVVYVKGTFSDLILGGQQVLYFNSNRTSGTLQDPIGWVAYPGAQASIDTVSTGSSVRGAISIGNNYMTFAKWTLHPQISGIGGLGEGIRVVGNEVTGPHSTPSGTGSIVVKGDNSEVLGNYIHGATSANRLDHGIYVNGCMPNVGAIVAYNHIEDFNVAEGPLIVVNHQEIRCPSSVRLASHYIHSNFVDCSGYPSRGIGIYDQSWDGASEQEPEPTYVYNNFVYSCGLDATWPAMYQNSAKVAWYNNTVYNGVGKGLGINNARVIWSKVKNNIFHMQSGSTYYVNHVVGTPFIENNLYFGAAIALPVEDTSPIELDPNISFDTLNLAISVSPGVEGKGITDSDIASVVKRDINGNLRPSPMSLGAQDKNAPQPKPPQAVTIQ
jgi:hypothetical protein